MIEKDKNEVSTDKRMRRRGQHYATQSKLVRGGIVEIDTLGVNLEGVYIRTPDGQGVVGYFDGGRLVDGSGNLLGYYIGLNALGGTVVVTGDALPASDDTYTLGSSTLAWQQVFSNNPFTVVSDRRSKDNIAELQYGLEEVKKLDPVSYSHKGTDTKRVGLIAQDVKEIIPEVVSGTEDTRYGIGYDSLVPVLINAIKELSAEVEELKKRIS